MIQYLLNWKILNLSCETTHLIRDESTADGPDRAEITGFFFGPGFHPSPCSEGTPKSFGLRETHSPPTSKPFLSPRRTWTQRMFGTIDAAVEDRF